MLNLIDRVTPENASMFLDTGFLIGKHTRKAFMNQEFGREKIDVNNVYEQGVERLAFIEYMLNHREVLVIDEVMKEMNGFARALRRYTELCPFIEKHKKDLMINYHEQVEIVIDELKDRDPRKDNNFKVDVPKIDPQSRE